MARDNAKFAVARRHPRLACFLIDEMRPEEEALVLGSLSDVSQRGCCVEISGLLSNGTGVAIRPLEATVYPGSKESR